MARMPIPGPRKSGPRPGPKPLSAAEKAKQLEAGRYRNYVAAGGFGKTTGEAARKEKAAAKKAAAQGKYRNTTAKGGFGMTTGIAASKAEGARRAATRKDQAAEKARVAAMKNRNKIGGGFGDSTMESKMASAQQRTRASAAAELKKSRAKRDAANASRAGVYRNTVAAGGFGKTTGIAASKAEGARRAAARKDQAASKAAAKKASAQGKYRNSLPSVSSQKAASDKKQAGLYRNTTAKGGFGKIAPLPKKKGSTPRTLPETR